MYDVSSKRFSISKSIVKKIILKFKKIQLQIKLDAVRIKLLAGAEHNLLKTVGNKPNITRKLAYGHIMLEQHLS